MGRRGPPPTPSALKLLRGNPGKRPINENEPQLPAPESLEPPWPLGESARKEWDRLAEPLTAAGVVTMADLGAFWQYCVLFGEYVDLQAEKSRVGDAAARTLGISNQLLKLGPQVRQLRADLGISPSARSQVRAVKPADSGDQRRKRFFGNSGQAKA